MVGVDRFHRALRDTGSAINTFVRVNDELTFNFVKAGDRAHFDAVSKLATHAFGGDNMGHKIILCCCCLKNDGRLICCSGFAM